MSEEKTVWSGKPTVLAFSNVLAGGALLVVVSIAVFFTPFPVWLPVLGIVCGLVLIFTAFAMAKANTYMVTDRYVRREYRFIAVKIDEAPLSKVTNIVVEQSVVGRFFRFGDIRFDTAGTAFTGVLFKGVKNPEKIEKQISAALAS